MKFVNLNEYKPSSALAAFYPGKGFSGNAQELGRGNYQTQQLLEKPAAVKLLGDFVSVVCYENTDKSGKMAVINKDCADMSAALGFEPAAIMVTLHAKCKKIGVKDEALLFGAYGIEALNCYDQIEVPDEMYVVFYGNGNDKHDVRCYSGETIPMDDRFSAYTMAAVMILGNIDAFLGISEEELSPEELLSVVGGAQDDEEFHGFGACKLEQCNLKACAADGPCAANV